MFMINEPMPLSAINLYRIVMDTVRDGDFIEGG